ncbi:DUF6444 domain-containing protein [Micromonospora sp. CA-111912]|uniref:DUF6444 domain-containing protein n=1 Tax=Micromonospora sp. CA-111912 TaxID=3239955 RepID=UPI003D93A90A
MVGIQLEMIGWAGLSSTVAAGAGMILTVQPGPQLPSVEQLVAVVAELRAEVKRRRADNARLRAENAELRRRLGLNSSNSSKPPAPDGLARPRPQPGKGEGSDQRRGKQPGGAAGVGRGPGPGGAASAGPACRPCLRRRPVRWPRVRAAAPAGGRAAGSAAGGHRVPADRGRVRRVRADHRPAVASGALVLDDTQAIKKGTKSVGVAPQHCGLTGLRFHLWTGHPEPRRWSGEGWPGATSIEVPRAVP